MQQLAIHLGLQVLGLQEGVVHANAEVHGLAGLVQLICKLPPGLQEPPGDVVGAGGRQPGVDGVHGDGGHRYPPLAAGSQGDLVEVA